jgi:hypothetical protein
MANNNFEQRVYDWLVDVGDRIGADRVGNLLGGAAVGVARTKATLDRNLDALLAIANIPSRRDYRRMQAKLDALQGSVISLSRTVEQLREFIAGGEARPGKHQSRSRGSSSNGRTGRAAPRRR